MFISIRIVISIAKNTIFEISLIMVFGSMVILKAPKTRIIEREVIPRPKGKVGMIFRFKTLTPLIGIIPREGIRGFCN